MLLLVSAGGVWLLGAGPPPLSTPDFLRQRGIEVASGAAAGYVPDRTCVGCHPDVAATYQQVGMARSFFRPTRDRAIEDFAHAEVTHEASRRTFQMLWRGDDLIFRRLLRDADGRDIGVFERKVDWILGSGNHARTYLYQTSIGELYQLPIAWYAAEGRWGMAPGFDRPDHQGVRRQITRECIFCHDAYPQLAAGADRYGMPQRFSAELPQGIGCQRCHGPGAEHVRRAMDPEAPLPSVPAAIVNPARLSPERFLAVCEQCHLEPAVALPGVRRFERGDFSFRPGEALGDYRVELDPEAAGMPRDQRFEIDHQAYRLEQSRCFRESAGALTCGTCHDPHRKVSPQDRAAHYRAACLTCHQESQCPVAAGATDHDASAAADAEAPHGDLPATPAQRSAGSVDRRDCVGCHMPQRRPSDVVHVVMTDHRIGLPPADPSALVAPRAETDPVLTDVELLRPAAVPAPPVSEIYRAVGVLRIGARSAALPYLERLLAAHPQPDPEPALRVGEAELLAHRWSAAAKTLAPWAPKLPRHALLRVWLGLAAAGQGQAAEAERRYREATALDPELPEARYDLGRLLMRLGRNREAAIELARAVRLRPNLPAAWLHLGELQQLAGDRGAALESYRTALAADPATTDAWIALARLQRDLGRRQDALATLRLAARLATDRDAVQAMRGELDTTAP